MKKKFLLGAVAIFSLALVVASCSDDDDETCVECTDGETTLEYCYDDSKLLDELNQLTAFLVDHPNHTDCND